PCAATTTAGTRSTSPTCAHAPRPPEPGHGSRGGRMDRQLALEAHRRMVRIRRFEETVARMTKRGEIPGSVHTSIGQEAAIVGACLALRRQDWITGYHRSHGHPIGKGAALRPLMAE